MGTPCLRDDGIGPSVVALPPGPWLSVLDFLAERFPRVGREILLARLSRGEIHDAAGRAVSPEARYRPYEKLYYFREVPDEKPLPVEEHILFQDERLVVVDKPHFLPMSPGGKHLRETLVVRLRKRLGNANLAPIHRLDRDTAGVVLFSVQPQTRGVYQRLFADRLIKKCYEAVAPVAPSMTFPLVYRSRLATGKHFLQMVEGEGSPNSETAVDCLDQRGEWAYYRLQPLTGKKHQLRIHMASLGLPIRNDRIYPVLAAADTPDDLNAPLQLLARSITFHDPLTGSWRRFSSRRSLQWPSL